MVLDLNTGIAQKEKQTDDAIEEIRQEDNLEQWKNITGG